MSDGWGKPTSDAATAVGARAVARLVDRGMFTLDPAARDLVARACALAVDEAIGSAIDAAEAHAAAIHALDADNAKLRRWRDALIDAAVVAWTYTAGQDDDPHALINALLSQVQREALDPAISKEARDLINRGRVEAGGAPRPADTIEDVDF